MLFDILTIFPDFFGSPLATGVIGKGIESGLLGVRCVDLRDFATDRHRTTDDRPFGGGEGMVMKPEPMARAIESLRAQGPPPMVIMLSPRGRILDQALARDLVQAERLVLICGRYEGVDERIHENFVDMEVSIGDYVLSGGETAALVLIEVVARLLPGVLGCASSAEKDSFCDGLLVYPQYTRPREFRQWPVPEILLCGDHAKIADWRRHQALRITLDRRPELLDRAPLSEADCKYLRSLGWPR